MKRTIEWTDIADLPMGEAMILAYNAKGQYEQTADTFCAEVMDLVDELVYIFGMLEQSEDWPIMDIHDACHEVVIEHLDNYGELPLFTILQDTEAALWANASADEVGQ